MRAAMFRGQYGTSGAAWWHGNSGMGWWGWWGIPLAAARGTHAPAALPAERRVDRSQSLGHCQGLVC